MPGELTPPYQRASQCSHWPGLASSRPLRRVSSSSSCSQQLFLQTNTRLRCSSVQACAAGAGSPGASSDSHIPAPGSQGPMWSTHPALLRRLLFPPQGCCGVSVTLKTEQCKAFGEACKFPRVCHLHPFQLILQRSPVPGQNKTLPLFSVMRVTGKGTGASSRPSSAGRSGRGQGQGLGRSPSVLGKVQAASRTPE